VKLTQSRRGLPQLPCLILLKSAATSACNTHVSRDQGKGLSPDTLLATPSWKEQKLIHPVTPGMGHWKPSKPEVLPFFPLGCQTIGALFPLPLKKVHKDHLWLEQNQLENVKLHLNSVSAAFLTHYCNSPCCRTCLCESTQAWHMGICYLSPTATEKEEACSGESSSQLVQFDSCFGWESGLGLLRHLPEPRLYTLIPSYHSLKFEYSKQSYAKKSIQADTDFKTWGSNKKGKFPVSFQLLSLPAWKVEAQSWAEDS
jgi:hypothetical protein